MVLFRIIHNDYLDEWQDYYKTNSFLNGARWNTPGVPVMYLSTNIQNAMLELANYMPNPKWVNDNYKVVVFSLPELRIHAIEPDELPQEWNDEKHPDSTRELGSSYLRSNKYDGILVPSATINAFVATSRVNAIRSSVYANIVINPKTIGIDNIKLLDAFSPVYSSKMFRK